MWYNDSVLQDVQNNTKIIKIRPLVNVLQDLITNGRILLKEVLQMTDKKLRDKTYAQVHRAVESGKAVKSESCELCGRGCKHVRISGHHWNGHENALDLWWVCQRCNSTLKGKHDGSLSISQAKELVKRDPRYGFCMECAKEKSKGVLVRHRG